MSVPSVIGDLSQTASSNGPSGSVDPPSVLDDYIRALSSFIAQLRDVTPNYLSASGVITTGGTQPNFTLTPAPAIGAYADGQHFRIKFHTTGTLGSNTLNISGQGAKNLVQYDGTGILVPAYVFANQLADAEVSGANIILRGTDLLLATVTNNNAPAGIIGEYVSSEVVQGSSPALTSGNALNVTSISLSAGDWDVGGYIGFNPAASTSFTLMVGSCSMTSATQDASRQVRVPSPANVPGSQIELAIPVSRLSISAPATVYLVATSVFSVSTCGAYGRIYARRAR